MGMSEFDPGSRGRRPWNAGRKVGAKRPLKPRQVWAIRFFLDQHGRLRDRALFDLAIDSKLRGCDVVKIKIGDVVVGAQIRTRAIVVSRRLGDRSSLSYRPTPEAVFSLGWIGEAAPSTTTPFQAALTVQITSAHANMLG